MLLNCNYIHNERPAVPLSADNALKFFIPRTNTQQHTSAARLKAQFQQASRPFPSQDRDTARHNDNQVARIQSNQQITYKINKQALIAGGNLNSCPFASQHTAQEFHRRIKKKFKMKSF